MDQQSTPGEQNATTPDMAGPQAGREYEARNTEQTTGNPALTSAGQGDQIPHTLPHPKRPHHRQPDTASQPEGAGQDEHRDNDEEQDSGKAGSDEKKDGTRNGQHAGDKAEAKGEEKEEGKGGKRRGLPPWAKPALAILGVVVLIGGILWGINYWHYSQTHVGTDDAYLTSDIVQITPQVAGSIVRLDVNDNEHVKRGQELARLDDTTYRAELAQAQANLNNALSSSQGSGLNVGLTQATTRAQILEAQGGVQQAEEAIRSAQEDVSRYTAAVGTAQAQTANALAQVRNLQEQARNARAGLDVARAARQRAAAQATGAQAAVDTALAAVQTAQAGLAAAAATAERADKDQTRYAVLYNQDAVSAQVLDSAVATARTSRAQVVSAQRQVEEATATVKQRQADLRAAQEQVRSADASIRQAQAQVAAAQEAVHAGQASADAAQQTVRQALAQVGAARGNVGQQQAKRTQALGQLQQARTAPTQVAVQRNAVATSRTRIAQARAELQTAQINLERTRLLAPVDGLITKRTGQLGQQLSVGQQIMTLIPDNDIWVLANYKETQLAHVRPGQHAEVNVDEVPGRTFTGHVDSISPNTGAAVSLLPPDNATGNFTKVVQRVPVKILLDPKQKDIGLLRAGLSVEATITTH